MVKGLLSPDYIFESSWEVCNKVGGIYTVLSTRAKTLQDAMKDRIIFLGPDFKEASDKYFTADGKLFAEWQQQALSEGLVVRVGRWNVPGTPVAVLIDFTQYYKEKNDIYTWINLMCSTNISAPWNIICANFCTAFSNEVLASYNVEAFCIKFN